MASCLISGGQTLSSSCDYQISGIQKLALMNWDDVTGFTKDATGVITQITLKTGSHAYDYSGFATESTGVTETLIVSGATKYVQAGLTSQFPLGEGLLEQIDAISLGKFVAQFQTKSGQNYLIGVSGLQSDGSMNWATGSALGDASGITLSLVGAELGWQQAMSDWDVVADLFDA